MALKKKVQKRKVALITGVTGQDGAYLSELLLEKGYEVHGIKRRSSMLNTARVDHIYQDPHVANSRFRLHYGDLTDGMNITRVIQEVRPDEIYNLGAMSHVMVSFEEPEYTANADAVGTLRILEAIRLLGLKSKTKFYQASSSELYGLVSNKKVKQNEKTPFYPRSPYGVAKLYAYWITVNYREQEDLKLFACNGILFNHESPRRGETFVTRKITRGVAQIVHGLADRIYLGNLDARRDWGHAKDYVKAMWLMLQQDEPDDYVVATGRTTTVRDFCSMAFEAAGISIQFQGKGKKEIGVIVKSSNSDFKAKPGTVVIEVDPNYFRPSEVDYLIGDAAKARKKLRWKPSYTLESMVKEMVLADLEVIRLEKLLKKSAVKKKG